MLDRSRRTRDTKKNRKRREFMQLKTVTELSRLTNFILSLFTYLRFATSSVIGLSPFARDLSTSHS